MATIFRASKPREALNFSYGTVGVIVDSFDVTTLSGDETFTIETSQGGPSVIGPFSGFGGFPYSSPTVFASDLEGAIDSAIGAGKVTVEALLASSEIPGEVQMLLTEVAGSFIEITNMSNHEFLTFPMPNIRVDATPSTTVQPQTSAYGKLNYYLYPPYNRRPGLSNLYEIPAGANEVVLWTSLAADANNADGYNHSMTYFVCWTNGTDGYTTDGYYNELSLNTNIFPDVLDLPGIGGLAAGHTTSTFPTQFINGDVGGGLIVGESIPVQNSTIRLPVPSGSIGMYLLIGSYFGDTDKPSTSPTFSCAVTSGTR